MGGRLTTVTRGMFIRKTDQTFANPDPVLLEKLEKLHGDQFTTVGRDNKWMPDAPQDTRHADVEFLGDGKNAYFPPTRTIPAAKTKRAILLSGCIQALRVALFKNPDEQDLKKRERRAKALPVVSYWIAGGRRFEIYVALSSTKQEVHMLIMTPDPKKPAAPPGAAKLENVWAIGAEGPITAMHNRFPKSWGVPEAFEINGAWCQQTFSY
jgi:hypothetical protein